MTGIEQQGHVLPEFVPTTHIKALALIAEPGTNLRWHLQMTPSMNTLKLQSGISVILLMQKRLKGLSWGKKIWHWRVLSYPFLLGRQCALWFPVSRHIFSRVNIAHIEGEFTAPYSVWPHWVLLLCLSAWQRQWKVFLQINVLCIHIHMSIIRFAAITFTNHLLANVLDHYFR